MEHSVCVKLVTCSVTECEPNLFITPSSPCVFHTSLQECICVDLGVCGKFDSKRVCVGDTLTLPGDVRRRLSVLLWSAQLLVSRVEARSRAQEEMLMFPFLLCC